MSKVVFIEKPIPIVSSLELYFPIMDKGYWAEVNTNGRVIATKRRFAWYNEIVEAIKSEELPTLEY